jgi:DNA-binding IclR family transcriptional regulator
LATAEHGMSLGELARVLDAPKSSLLMLLRTLVELAYVERDSNERYVINPSLRSHELGWIGGPHSVLARTAHPFLRQLTESVRETSFVAVITADQHLRLLSKVVSPREIRYDIDLSIRHVPHKVASGRAQLAYWSAERLEGYLDAWKIKDVPVQDRVDEPLLMHQLEQVRAGGIALLIDEWVAGATGVSAPVFDADGMAIGAVTVGSVTARFLADRDEMIEAVKLAGERITKKLPDGLRRVRASQPSGARGKPPRKNQGNRHAVS